MRTWIHCSLFVLFIFSVFSYIQEISEETSNNLKNIEYSSYLPSNLDKEFIPHVLSFIARAEKNGVDVNLSDQGDSFVGMCFYKDYKIGISPKFWNSPEVTNLTKQELIMHELGHCVLGRVHEMSLVRDKYDDLPKSIMYDLVFSQDLMIDRFNEYDKELFNPSEFNKLPLDLQKQGYFIETTTLGDTANEFRSK
jgi:hypothetical protein